MNSRNVNIKMKAKCQAILPSCTFITALKLKTYIHAIIDKTFSLFFEGYEGQTAAVWFVILKNCSKVIKNNIPENTKYLRNFSFLFEITNDNINDYCVTMI